MAIAWIHFDASHGEDASAVTTPFAASPASNAIINSSTPPDRGMYGVFRTAHGA